MGFVVVVASDDVFLRAQVSSDAGARRALSDLARLLGSDTYPSMDAPGAVGGWSRLGSVHSNGHAVVVATGQGAMLTGPAEVESRDVASAWVPSAASDELSAREQEFVRHPERFPQVLAMSQAGVPLVEALHGPDRSESSRVGVWMVYADRLPFVPSPGSSDQLRAALSVRSQSMVEGESGVGVTRLGGVGRVPAGGAVHLFAGGNRVCRFEQLLSHERDMLCQLGYGQGVRV